MLTDQPNHTVKFSSYRIVEYKGELSGSILTIKINKEVEIMAMIGPKRWKKPHR